MPRRYTPEQLETVFERSQAKTWDDALRYLEAHGAEAGLSHDQIGEMEEDLEKMKDRDEPFETDARRVYEIIDSVQPEGTVFGWGSTTPEEAPGGD